MVVWVIICFAFTVLFPVLVRVLVLGTSPVLQRNDPLWSTMWGREEGGRERKRREKEMRRGGTGEKEERERDGERGGDEESE